MSKWNDKNIAEKLKKKIADRLKTVGEFVEGAAKLNISGQNGAHLKAVDTGRLFGSITHEVDKKELSVKIGTNVEYAGFVEFGTGEKSVKKGFKGLGKPTGAKRSMRSRPYLRTAFYESKANVRQILRAG